MSGVKIKKIKICNICGKSNENERIFYHAGTDKLVCNKHYIQITRYRKFFNTRYDPNEIIIQDGYAEIIMVDNNGDEIARTQIDLDMVSLCSKYKWHLNKKANKLYARGFYKINGKRYSIYLHQVITGIDRDSNQQVDHINGNGLDNRKKNLRICSLSSYENTRNLQKSHLNTSGIVGVHWCKTHNKWISQIRIHQQVVKKYFDNKEDAIIFRLKCEMKYDFISQQSLHELYGLDHQTDLSMIPDIIKRSYELDKKKVIRNNAKAKNKGLVADLTLEEFRQMMSYFMSSNGELECPYCNKNISDFYVLEHVIALANKGGNTISNVIVSCKSCNNNKKDKVMLEWFKSQSFYKKENEEKLLEYINNTDKYIQKNVVYLDVLKTGWKYFKAISPNGTEYVSNNQTKFALQHKLNIDRLRSVLAGKLKDEKGFTFFFLKEEELFKHFKSIGFDVRNPPLELIGIDNSLL